jgi:hypothetical protein
MLNIIPVIGWLLDLVFKVSLSIPFWFIWTHLGIGKKYFPFLPETFLSVPFWDCVGIFIVVPIVYHIFVPRFVSVSSSSEAKLKEIKDDKAGDKKLIHVK